MYRLKSYGFWFTLMLLCIGLVHWWSFLQIRDDFYRAYDWIKAYRYLYVLKSAMIHKQIPYEASVPLLYIGDQKFTRFMSIPETTLSPQVLLLLFIDIKCFAIFNILIMYTIGFIALIFIKRHLKLNIISFFYLFILFNFNGYIVSHISVGHFMWNGYFLTPYIVLFMLRFIDKPRGFWDILGMSVTLSALILQGSLHIFVWCLLFVIVCIPFYSYNRLNILFSVIVSLALSFFRTLPAFIYLGSGEFLGGYPSTKFLIISLIDIHSWQWRGGATLGFWEYSMYINIIGVIFLLYFGIYSLQKNIANIKYLRLMPATITMFILSLGDNYSNLKEIVPLLQSERVSSRMIIIPFLVILIFSVVSLQQHIESKKGYIFAMTAMISGIANLWALFINSYTWSMGNIESDPRFPSIIWRDIDVQIVATNDIYYIRNVNISIWVSLMSYIILIIFTIYKLYTLRMQQLNSKHIA